MQDRPPKTLPTPLTHVVIIGAGLIGLDLANQLKEAKVEQVTLVDARAGNCARFGLIHDPTFTDLPNPSIPAEYSEAAGWFIEDMERLLFKKAEGLRIKIIKSDFIRISNRKIKLANGEELPCDLAIDCSGTKQILIKEVNRLIPNNTPFTITPITQLPAAMYMLAHLKIAANKLARMGTPQTENQLRHLLKAQKEFSWHKKFFPDMSRIRVADDELVVYCEIPDDLPIEKQSDWLQCVFQINGLSHLEFKPVPSKHNVTGFMQFKVHPHEVLPFFYQGDQNLPFILVAGDALIHTHFSLGRSFNYGRERNGIFVECLEVKNGKIVAIHLEQLKERYEGMLATQRSEEDFRAKGLLEFDLCNLLRENLSHSNSKACLEMVDEIETNHRIKYLYDQASAKCQHLKKTIAEDKSSDVLGRRAALLEVIALFLDVFKLIKNEDPYYYHEKCLDNLKKLAQEIKCKGEDLYKKGEFENSKAYYTFLLDIYAVLYVEPELSEEKAIIYSNLTLIARKSDDLKALDLGDQAIGLIHDAASIKWNEKICKIRYNQIVACLNVGLKKEKNLFSAGETESYFNKAKILLFNLASNNGISEESYNYLIKMALHVAKKYHLECGDLSYRKSERAQQKQDTSQIHP